MYYFNNYFVSEPSSKQNLPAPSSRRQEGVGAKPLALGDFSIQITHFYAYFGQNNYFKAITHQLKAFKISLSV